MKKILVADDEPDILKVVEFRLIKAGYEVILTSNGKEALEQFKKVKPDLVLLDYSMPIMNGDEVCIQIKADPETQSIPVIFMTASTKIVADQYIKKIGADDWVLKPFDPEILLKKIKNLIG